MRRALTIGIPIAIIIVVGAAILIAGRNDNGSGREPLLPIALDAEDYAIIERRLEAQQETSETERDMRFEQAVFAAFGVTPSVDEKRAVRDVVDRLGEASAQSIETGQPADCRSLESDAASIAAILDLPDTESGELVVSLGAFSWANLLGLRQLIACEHALFFERMAFKSDEASQQSESGDDAANRLVLWYNPPKQPASSLEPECLDSGLKRGLIRTWLHQYRGLTDLPTAGDSDAWTAWEKQNPETLAEACDDALQQRDEEKAGEPATAAMRLLAKSVADAGVEYWGMQNEGLTAFADLSEHGVPDAAIVWCSKNGSSLVSAADALGFGPSAQDALNKLIEVRDVTTDAVATYTVRELTNDRQVLNLWFATEADHVARSCIAAFETR
jgi:hypothetical protein